MRLACSRISISELGFIGDQRPKGIGRVVRVNVWVCVCVCVWVIDIGAAP